MSIGNAKISPIRGKNPNRLFELFRVIGVTRNKIRDYKTSDSVVLANYLVNKNDEATKRRSGEATKRRSIVSVTLVLANRRYHPKT